MNSCEILRSVLIANGGKTWKAADVTLYFDVDFENKKSLIANKVYLKSNDGNIIFKITGRFNFGDPYLYNEAENRQVIYNVDKVNAKITRYSIDITDMTMTVLDIFDKVVSYAE